MQRRDPRSFLEGVMATVPDLSEAMQKELLEIVHEKAGTKRAAHLAQILAGDVAVATRVAAADDDDDEEVVAAPKPAAAKAAPVETAPPPTVASPAPAPAAAAPKKRASRKKAAAEPAVKNTNPFAGEISDEDAS